MSRADVLRTIKDAEADASATLAKAESETSNIVTKARIAAAETVSVGRNQAQAPSLIHNLPCRPRHRSNHPENAE